MLVGDSYEYAEVHCTQVPQLLLGRGDIASLKDYVDRKCEP